MGQRQAHLGPLRSPPPMAGPQTRPWGPNGLASLQSVLHAVLLHTLYHTKALHFTSRSHSHCLYSKPPWINSKLNFIFNFSLHFLHCQQHQRHNQQQSDHSHLAPRHHGLEKWHVVSHGSILSLLQTHQEELLFLIFLCIFDIVSNITIINLIINLILLIIMVV